MFMLRKYPFPIYGTMTHPTQWCDQPTGPTPHGVDARKIITLFFKLILWGTNYGVSKQSAPFAGQKGTHARASRKKSRS